MVRRISFTSTVEFYSKKRDDKGKIKIKPKVYRTRNTACYGLKTRRFKFGALPGGFA